MTTRQAGQWVGLGREGDHIPAAGIADNMTRGGWSDRQIVSSALVDDFMPKKSVSNYSIIKLAYYSIMKLLDY